MKISGIRSSLEHLGLAKPYSIAGYTFTDVSIAFLEIELANGIIGLGTGSPAEEVVGETAEMCALNLASDFVQRLVGRDIADYQSIIRDIRAHFPHLPGTQAAIDLALHDAFAKWKGKSVISLFGQKIKELPTSVTIGIMSIDEAIEEARAFEKLGFKILKVKTGENVEEDIERVKRLQEHIGKRMKIRVDPNQGYDLSALKKFILQTSGIELIEQPLPVGRETELLGLGFEGLMADESITDLAAAKKWSQKPMPFNIYNIKLMKAGGIQSAMEIAQVAQRAQINIFWGCNDESILSITAALHVAYAMPNTRYLDLDGSFDLAHDIVKGGFRLHDGCMRLEGKLGFGVEKR
jgi:L-alanine-DL-glutamate epimerase-like enolase superfamily enzyme